MPILGKLKNIFGVGSSNSGDGRKKAKFPYIKQELDPNECWDIVGELGDGAFGKVYKAQSKQKREYAALKQVDINNESELEDYSVEIDILVQCKHKNVVGLYESYLFGGKLWMFIEFCELGALDSIMLELEKPLTEPQIQYICHEMCEGLDFLHQSFIIHRDLKAGNVLLTQDGGVRLADFGVSAKNSSLKQKRDSYIGTPYWMAPEVILCETIKDSPYDFRADIWSFGITLIEFSQIEPPNHEMHPMRVVLKIQKSDPPTLRSPHKWSKDFNDFIAKCLVKDPEKRWTTAELQQHPFIRDVRNKEGISDLVSELGAEITLEEKDIEEDLDTDQATDSDTSSLSKTNEGSCVDVPGPRIVVDVCRDSEIIGDVKLKEPIKVQDSDVGLKPNASLKTISEVEQQAKVAADDETKDDFEGVIFRDKKNKSHPDDDFKPSKKDADSTPSPEPKSNQSEANKKKYRSLTKTRKFLVNGEVVTSKVQKLITKDGEEKQKEHILWKADLRELKMLHRMENRQLQDLDFKSQQAIEEQLKRFEQDELTSRNMYEANLDMLSKQHKQHIDKMHSTHAYEKKSLMKKIKSEQDRDLKSFTERLKQEMKLLKQEVEMLPKETRKEALNLRKNVKEVDHLERQQKFNEDQRKHMDKSMMRLDDQQAEQYALSEKQFLQQKQQIIRAKEEALWDMEEKHMMERYQLAEQLLKNKFILKRSLMMQRHSKETDQVKRINSCKEDELLACHALELKRLPKILKSDAKTRTLMYRESIRISVINITLDEEREKIKKFEEKEKKRAKEERARLEAKHRRQLDDLRAKNNNLIKELEQVQCDKQRMLLENEMQKTAELGNSYRIELSKWKEELGPKKKKLEELFTNQLVEQEKLLSVRDYQGALAITTSASVTPVLRKKFPQSFLFGRITDQNQEEESGVLRRENSLRSSKRSSTFGGLADKFRDSVRTSVVIVPDEDKQSRRFSDQVSEGVKEEAPVKPERLILQKMEGREGEDVEKIKAEKSASDAVREAIVVVSAVEGDEEKQMLDDSKVSDKEEDISGMSFNSSNQEANIELPIVSPVGPCEPIAIESFESEKVENVPVELEVAAGGELKKDGMNAEGEQLKKDGMDAEGEKPKKDGMNAEGEQPKKDGMDDEGDAENEASVDEIIDLHYNFDDNEEADVRSEGHDDDIKVEDNPLIHEKLKSESRDDEEYLPETDEMNPISLNESSVITPVDKADDDDDDDDNDGGGDDDDEAGLTYDDNDISFETEQTNEEILSDEKDVDPTFNLTQYIGNMIEDCKEAVSRETADEQDEKTRTSNEKLDGDDECRDALEFGGEARGDSVNVHLVSLVESLRFDDDTFPKGDSHEIAPSKEVNVSGRGVELPAVGDECTSFIDDKNTKESPIVSSFELPHNVEIQSQLIKDQSVGDPLTNDLSPGESKASDSAIDTTSPGSPPNSSDALSDLVNTNVETVCDSVSVDVKSQTVQPSESEGPPPLTGCPDDDVLLESKQPYEGTIIPEYENCKKDDVHVSEDEGCCVAKSENTESVVPSKASVCLEKESEA